MEGRVGLALKLELNQQAIESFNARASQLLTAIVSQPPPPGNVDPEKLDLHIAGSIPMSEMQDFTKSHSDHLDREDARFFSDGQNITGLAREGFKDLRRLSEAMQKAIRPRGTVSLEYLTDLIFEWVKGKYEEKTLPPMTEYVLEACEKRIEEIEILIPISSLRIQSPFTIGRVSFATLTRQTIDKWQAQFTAHRPEGAETAAILTTRWRKQMQGYAAATVKIEAEPIRAAEVAFEETEKAVGLLRFFSGANFHPQLVSYCAPLGALRDNRRNYFRVRGEEMVEFYASNRRRDWPLSDADLSENRRLGLDTLSALLLQEEITDFQEELIQALLLYSKSSTAHDVAEKLIYILIAIESMFVKDGQEALQSSIRERMAFFAGRSGAEREAIRDNVTMIYGIRSSFLHHGRHVGIDKLDAIEEFMLLAWRCLQGLIQLGAKDTTTKEEFFRALEKKKWTASDDIEESS